MNIRQLEAFRAVMVAGSVTGAGEILRISQPAVSRLIADLERDVGFSLFARRRKRLHPTPEATYLFGEVERSFSGVDKITQVVQDIRNLKTGYLQIACLASLSFRFLPAVVTEFLAGRPDVMVSLQPRSSAKMVEWIEAQQFDIGIAELPAEHPAIDLEPVSLRCVCVLPPGHPLAHKEIISAADLDGLPFISLNRDHATSRHLQNAFAQARAKRNVWVETRLFATACGFVASGGGVSVVDPLTAADYVPWGVEIRRFEPAIPFDIGILFPAHRPRSRLVESFAATLEERLRPFAA